METKSIQNLCSFQLHCSTELSCFDCGTMQSVPGVRPAPRSSCVRERMNSSHELHLCLFFLFTFHAGNSPAQPDGNQALESPCSPTPRYPDALEASFPPLLHLSDNGRHVCIHSCFHSFREERRNEEEEDCEFRLLSDVGSLSDEVSFPLDLEADFCDCKN